MELIKSKSGLNTVSINSTILHSRYSPDKEAEKFIKKSIHAKNGTVIVIGSGLGYILKEISTHFPLLKIVSIPLNKELAKLSNILNPTNKIEWDFNKKIQDFINDVITEKSIKNLQIISWQPTTKLYPAQFNEINNLIVRRVRKINGNILTTARFGRIWIKNAISNYLKTDNYIKYFYTNKPIAIVASGPSLNKSLHLLKKYRDNIVIIALSSSLLALKNKRITPDLVFSTDPGYYSKVHMYNCNITTAMPLSNSTANNCSVLLINQGNKFEEDIIKLSNLPCVKIPENGTVAGTALEFALNTTNSTVYLFGQDLSSSGIKSHVTPHAFDNLLKSTEDKTSSYYSIMFQRWINQGISYRTYRDWFSDIAIKHSGRIKRVTEKSKEIENIQDIEINEFKSYLPKSENESKYTINEVKAESKKSRLKKVKILLKSWLNELEEEKIGSNELIYLISTSKYTDVNNKTLSDDAYRDSIKFIKRLLTLYGRELL